MKTIDVRKKRQVETHDSCRRNEIENFKFIVKIQSALIVVYGPGAKSLGNVTNIPES